MIVDLECIDMQPARPVEVAPLSCRRPGRPRHKQSYPVALFSETLKPRLKANTVAAAMCCYGAQVYSPKDPAAQMPGSWPVSSTYLRDGGLGFAGSTRIAWVGVSGMMCADWVVTSYLKALLGGASLGRAFLESKQDYLRWISQQGRGPDIKENYD